MKIIITVHQFLPEFFAGTEILSFETARELTRRGHQVEVWTGHPPTGEPDSSGEFDNYVYDGVPVRRFYHYYLPLTDRYRYWEFEYNNTVFGWHFKDLLESQKPDLVHCFHLGNLSASLITECARHHLPTVFTATDFWLVCPKCQLLLPDHSMCDGPNSNGANCLAHMLNRNYLKLMPEWLTRLVLWLGGRKWWPEKHYLPLMRALLLRKDFLRRAVDLIDRILVPTQLMRNVLSKHGAAPEKIRFVPYGVNLSYIGDCPLKSPAGKIRLGFIGTIAEHKGAHVLLEAVRLLPEDLPLEVFVYGRLEDVPAYASRLREIAGGDGRIRFCGTFSNKEIGRIFSQLDCLVVPSLWYENTPLVIYSAQAAKTPVIATNLGGMTEVIKHEENGLLFEKGNAEQLAGLIRRICEDRALLKVLSANSVPPKSVSDYVDGLEEIYGEVAGKIAGFYNGKHGREVTSEF
ncbi:MAG TPA: glycosyltransferase family 4 protein [Bacillota bacterium]|nr:glycosyltransferase family 4 protein [Bacillota bacterium]